MATMGVVHSGGHFHHLRLPRAPFPSPSSTATVGGNQASSRRPVCKFWLQGRCSRRPCPFLHSRDTPPTPAHHPPTQLQYHHHTKTQQQQQRRGSPPRSLVWRNPNPVPTSAPCPKSRDDGGQKCTDVTCDEDAPECLPPPIRTPPDDGDEGKESTIIALGEDAPECFPPPTTTPPRDDDDEEDKKSTVITLGDDAVEVECPPPPTPTPRHADDGDDGNCAPPGGGSSFSLLTVLGGHQQPVTGIALPPGSDKIFSGSADGTVRVWDCNSGQCVQVMESGGPVSCVITDGHWVFAGGRSGVHGCNTQTGTAHTLPGLAGQVCSLDTSTDMVFAGMADGSILAWKVTVDTAAGGDGLCFQPAASLGGHTSAVVSLAVGCHCSRLYSGSADGTIRSWDVQTLQCIYTVSAHDDVVTSLICWSLFLLSCSLDGTIKVWAAVAKEGESGGDGGGLREVYTRHEDHGVLLLNGVYDTEGRHILMCSLADSTVRLYDLPGFSDRGRIACRGEVRAMHSGPRGFFFTGDDTGELSVWRWS